jgi:RHS repeat-associated protein
VSERLLRISDGSGVANNANTANTANNEQGNEIARYAYDPFGRRIKKTVSQNPSGQGSTGTTLYFYADEGLIAEVDGSPTTNGGNIITTYGWMPASANTGTWGTAPQWKRDHAGQSGATNPQGDASTNGVEHYYHVDHLGTSQRLTNAQGETTWRMVSEAFGKTFVDTTLAPTTTGTTTNNFRFPGQYEDVETGTYYNFMRTYLPMVGRYGETDPIGLGGGVNTYAYVEGNPLSFTDPLGLERFFGEDRANEFLRNNGCNSERAWEALRQHRNTYPGLREADRNGEHYLYARYNVEANSYNWGVFHVATTGYHTTKFWSNALLGGKSPFRGSPATSDEMMAGHYGANDGLWGSPCECK